MYGQIYIKNSDYELSDLNLVKNIIYNIQLIQLITHDVLVIFVLLPSQATFQS